MTPWKRLILLAYYYGTFPWRCWWGQRAAEKGRTPLSVIFYHRVADSHPNAWTISTARFAQHLEWLQANFDLIALSEAQRRIRGDSNSRPAVSITFDDGYADNFETAIPLLRRRGIPCTYFVSTHHVLRNVPFPHDVAANRPLAPNSLEQLQRMAAWGFEIGVHTRRHVDLGGIRDPHVLHEEIVVARHELEDALGSPVRYFACPYGQHANLSPLAFQMARGAGYDAVCSAYGGYNLPGGDPFHIERIHADPEMIRLKNWLIPDPRKRWITRHYHYQPQPTSVEART